jgi:hypothetical protein
VVLNASSSHPSPKTTVSAFSPASGRSSHFYQSHGKPRVDRSAEDLSKYKNLYWLAKLGIVDILGALPPVGDYQRVAEQAVEMPMFGRTCRFVSIDDLITVKAFVGRPKDKLVEQELRAIRARLRGAP